MTVLVQDVNDQTPRFQHSRYAARIAESEVPPKYISRVAASDGDDGTNAKITSVLTLNLEIEFESRIGLSLR